MKDVGSWRCQKKILCILTTGQLMGVTVAGIGAELGPDAKQG
jgi:hypothetical protein